MGYLMQKLDLYVNNQDYLYFQSSDVVIFYRTFLFVKSFVCLYLYVIKYSNQIQIIYKHDLHKTIYLFKQFPIYLSIYLAYNFK